MHNVREQRAALDRARSATAVVLHAAAEEMSRTLVGLARREFDALARGGTTSDGRRWPARRGNDRQAAQQPVGVATGQLLRSLRVQPLPRRSTRTRVEATMIAYGAPHAVLFDRLRRLLPSSLPPAWRQSLTPTLSTTADQLEQAVQRAADE